VLTACGPGEAVVGGPSADTSASSGTASPPESLRLVVTTPPQAVGGPPPQSDPDVALRDGDDALVTWAHAGEVHGARVAADGTMAATELALVGTHGRAVGDGAGWTVVASLDDLLVGATVDASGASPGGLTPITGVTPRRPAITWIDGAAVVAATNDALLDCFTFDLGNLLSLQSLPCGARVDPERLVAEADITPADRGPAVAWSELGDDGAFTVHVASHRGAYEAGQGVAPVGDLGATAAALVVDGERHLVVGHHPTAGDAWLRAVPAAGDDQPPLLLAENAEGAPALAGPWRGAAVAAWVTDGTVWLQARDIASGAPRSQVLAVADGVAPVGMPAVDLIDGGFQAHGVVAWAQGTGDDTEVWARAYRVVLEGP